MLTSVQFKNFKVLRDTTLPLSRFTLIVGPNGSGKSTALQALEAVSRQRWPAFHEVASAELPLNEIPPPMITIRHPAEVPPGGVAVILRWAPPHEGEITIGSWLQDEQSQIHHYGQGVVYEEAAAVAKQPGKIKIYSLDARAIALPVQLQPGITLTEHGGSLAGVLDRLRDEEPERFEALNDEVGRWFPEFDRILFETPALGQRAFLLRTRKGHHKIPASDLSQGTLLALAILTLGYLPDPPSIVGIEEPERGIHPRLLRQIQDALYRLSYPENFGEKREPTQVIATTHSPYFLDLYKDHPEEVVIAQKTPEGACFERLSEQPHIIEILGDAPLGEVWYSGVLGGVPVEQ